MVGLSRSFSYTKNFVIKGWKMYDNGCRFIVSLCAACGIPSTICFMMRVYTQKILLTWAMCSKIYSNVRKYAYFWRLFSYQFCSGESTGNGMAFCVRLCTPAHEILLHFAHKQKCAYRIQFRSLIFWKNFSLLPVSSRKY